MHAIIFNIHYCITSFIYYFYSKIRYYFELKMAKVSTSKPFNKELEIESSKAVLNDDDLELIIMYLENKKRSNCGFEIDDYKLHDKYNICVKFESINDKLAMLKLNDTNALDLSIKDFNLTVNLPIEDLIKKQEGKYVENNQMLILYQLEGSTKSNEEFREHLVDAFTSDIDNCEHVDITFSKIFKDCIYVTYSTIFDRKIVQEKYKLPKISKNCKYLFSYENLNYLVLKIKENEQEVDVTDELKAAYSFKSVRSVNNLILLEFKKTEDMDEFLADNSERYSLEKVHNLKLVTDCDIIEVVD